MDVTHMQSGSSITIVWNYKNVELTYTISAQFRNSRGVFSTVYAEAYIDFDRVALAMQKDAGYRLSRREHRRLVESLRKTMPNKLVATS
jgi:hypothetical protein